MIIYLTFIAILFLMGLAQEKNKRLLTVFLVGYVIIAACRGVNVGADTQDYVLDYSAKGAMSWGMLLKEYSTNFGYFFVAKLFYVLGFNYHIWFGIVALIYGISICCLLKKYAKNQLLSILLFFALGFFSFSLAGLKQVLAMSMLNFFLFLLREKHYWKALFIGAIASVFHITVLVPIAVIFVFILIKNERIMMTAVVLFSIIFVVFRGPILNKIFQILRENNSHYGSYGVGEGSTYTYTTLIIQGIMLLYMLLFDRSDKFSIMMLCLACVFQFYASGANGVAAMFRISMYFNGYSIISIGNAMTKSLGTEYPITQSFTNQKRKTIFEDSFTYYLLLCFVLVVYFIFSTMKAGSIYPYTLF